MIRRIPLYLNIILYIIPSIVFAFSGGDGTRENPFQIATAAQLDSVRYYCTIADSGTCFMVTNDIDLTTWLSPGNPGYNNGACWMPIGDSTNSFYGYFDGNSHKITGLKINRPQNDHVGLFGYIYGCSAHGGWLQNIGIEALPGDTIIGRHCVGAIAGLITGREYAGGSIWCSYSTVPVKGSTCVGGLVGWVDDDGVMVNCYATGSVCGINGYAGGCIGRVQYGFISKCYATGAVSGGDYLGGLIGYRYTGQFGGYWDIQTTGQGAAGRSDVYQGYSTAEMKLQSTYIGWDFTSTWSIGNNRNGNYPYLQWQFVTGIDKNVPAARRPSPAILVRYKNGRISFSSQPPENTTLIISDLNGRIVYKSIIQGTPVSLSPATHRIVVWKLQHPDHFITEGILAIRE